MGRACLARVRPDGVWTWRDGAGVDLACENVVMGNESELSRIMSNGSALSSAGVQSQMQLPHAQGRAATISTAKANHWTR